MELTARRQINDCGTTYSETQVRSSANRFFEQKAKDKLVINQSRNHLSLIKTPKILLIEDTEMIQKVHLAFLNQLGCLADLAKDGFEAMDKFSSDYDLILLDIGLPPRNGISKSGLDVIKEIRCYENTMRIQRHPVIVLTALDDSIREECHLAGCDDFYLKPLSLIDLNLVLKSWLPQAFFYNQSLENGHK